MDAFNKITFILNTLRNNKPIRENPMQNLQSNFFNRGLLLKNSSLDTSLKSCSVELQNMYYTYNVSGGYVIFCKGYITKTLI